MSPLTTLHPTELVVTVSTLHAVDDLIPRRMEVPDAPEGRHVIPLSVPEAEAVMGMLVSGGQLHDEDGPWLTVVPGGTSLTLLPENWRYTGLRQMEPALHLALTVLVTHPPRQYAVDRG